MTQTLQTAIWPYALSVFRLMPLFLLPGLAITTWMPGPARIALTATLAVILTHLAVPENAMQLPGDGLTVGMLLLSELLLGLALAFSVHLVFGVLQTYGRVLDLQMGFGAAGVVDPTTENSSALIGTALTMTATVLFFAWNLHHEILRGLAASMQVVPLGSGWAPYESAWLPAAFARLFLFGISVVAPIVVGLFLLDLSIAYASRMMPQVNIYFMSLPLKLAVGLWLAALGFGVAGPAVHRLFAEAIGTWPTIMGAGHGG